MRTLNCESVPCDCDLRKLRAQVPQKDKDYENVRDDMKKSETQLNESLEELTSCLCEHPNGGSEGIHNLWTR